MRFHQQDILCMPRVYCEKMKRRKHVIDQYPNTKKVAAWLVGRYRDGCLEMKMIIENEDCQKALKRASYASRP